MLCMLMLPACAPSAPWGGAVETQRAVPSVSGSIRAMAARQLAGVLRLVSSSRQASGHRAGG
jgi:hypothetical protein